MNRKKGFTLIELLAVIIILAIIALIATPIVMRVIENSKKAAAERGAENYVRAVETQALALRGQGTILEGTYGINSNGNLCPNNAASCGENEIKIEMNGTKPSSGSVVISNGKVVASGANNTSTTLTIGDYTATINENGSATATKGSESSEQDIYAYLWYDGSNVTGPSIRDDASSLATSAPVDKNYYLKYKLDNTNKVTNSYACVIFGGEEYCLEGGSADTYGFDTDAASSTGNVAKLYKIQSSNITGVSCSFNSDDSNCTNGLVDLIATLDGSVTAYDIDGDDDCFVSNAVSSNCTGH